MIYNAGKKYNVKKFVRNFYKMVIIIIRSYLYRKEVYNYICC